MGEEGGHKTRNSRLARHRISASSTHPQYAAPLLSYGLLPPPHRLLHPIPHDRQRFPGRWKTVTVAIHNYSKHNYPPLARNNRLPCDVSLCASLSVCLSISLSLSLQHSLSFYSSVFSFSQSFPISLFRQYLYVHTNDYTVYMYILMFWAVSFRVCVRPFPCLFLFL